MNDDRPPRYCLFGAGSGTGNLGASALRLAFLDAIARRAPRAGVTVFDDRAADGPVAGILDRCGHGGGMPGPRTPRPESPWRIRLAGHLRGSHPVIQAIRAADVVIDGSGGDGFSDLHGGRRFRAIALPKIVAIEQGTPLVLAPQAIGPFRSPRCRRVARDVLDAADLVFARDAGSLAVVRQLLGPRFDPDRHRSGVDVAFGLGSRAPGRPLPGSIESWLFETPDRPLIAFDVSELLFHRPAVAARRFGLRADYRQTIFAIIRQLLHDTDANIMFVPHVVTPRGRGENDLDAMTRITESIHSPDQPRVAIVPPGYDAAEIKWLISRADWCCATRLPATIAALGAGVACAGVAFSDQTRGVFDSCGVGAHVADARTESDATLVEQVFTSWRERDAAAAQLSRRLPAVREAIETQMDAMLVRTARAAGAVEPSLPKAA